VIVLHQNCEIEYAAEEDSRVTVAPIVSEPAWPAGPWDLIARGELPGYLHLPPLDIDEARELGLDQEWPRAAVTFAGATGSSRGIVKPNRILALTPAGLTRFQESLVRFSTVRGWGSLDAAEALVGATVVAVKETAETVPGPARLAKIILGRGGEVDELTVAWGLRRSGAPL
jgi:hypothetical protein